MKQIVKFTALCLLLVFLAIPVSLVWLGMEKTPRVTGGRELTYDDVNHAKKIIKANTPRRLYLNRKKTLHLTQADINLLLDYAVSHGLHIPSLRVKAEMASGRANGFVSFRLPWYLSGYYFNLSLSFETKNNLVEPVQIRIGRITVPEEILRPVTRFVHGRLLKTARYAEMWSHIRHIDRIILQPEVVIVHYHLTYQTVERIKKTGRQFFLPREQQQRLLTYHNHLAGLTRQTRTENRTMTVLIREMIAFAGEQTRHSRRPVLENTAAIQVLSLYAVGLRLDTVLGKDLRPYISKTVPFRLSFWGRRDLPKHFIVSAALAASTGSKFAGLVGLAKEVDDSDGGSGFSFADLAADKAGVRFGELAVASRAAALAFQEKTTRLRDYTQIMPAVHDLPEGIMKLEFKTAYRDLDSAAYQMVTAEIENRLNRCWFYMR